MNRHPFLAAQCLRRNRLSASLALALSFAAPAGMAAQSSPAGSIAAAPPPAIADAARPLTRDRPGQSSHEPVTASSWQEMIRQRDRVESLLPRPRGAVHVVTNCNDTGSGSLRTAVSIAGDGDEIDLSQLTCSTITLDSAITIEQDSLYLSGAVAASPADLTTISAAVGTTSGLLRHSGSGNLTIENLALVAGTKYGLGSAAVRGGCVASSGHLVMSGSAAKYCFASSSDDGDALGGALYAADGISLVSSVISGNTARAEDGIAYGGGLQTPGPLLVKYSIIRDNNAESATGDGTGGGIWAGAGGLVQRSTVSGNTATVIGGLSMVAPSGEDIGINHGTVSGNESTGSGAAGGAYFHTSGAVVIRNSTFADNIAHVDAGAGLVVGGPDIQLVSNMVTGNWYDDGAGILHASDFYALDVSSGSYNLIGWKGVGSEPVPTGTIRQAVAPLGPLADNGGTTMTHRPLAGNWAFNRGMFEAQGVEPDADQTGAPRLVGAGVDIGAFESDTLFVDGLDMPQTF